jgi:hypothetical protein
VIDIHADKKANSTTHFQATLFGDPYSLGSVVYLYGFYADELMENAKGKWLIEKRELVSRARGGREFDVGGWVGGGGTELEWKYELLFLCSWEEDALVAAM